jgi:hypothetical protein
MHLFLSKSFLILQVYLHNRPNQRLKACFSTTSVSAEVKLVDDLLRSCRDVFTPDEA